MKYITGLGGVAIVTLNIRPAISTLLSTRSFALASGAVVMLIGLFGVIGWLFDIPILRGSDFTFVAMKANTTASLLLSGFTLVLHVLAPRSSTARWLTLFSASLVTLVGFLTLGEYATNTSFGIDEVLLADAAPSALNRMGPNTAFTFFFTGLGLLGTSAGHAPRLTEGALVVVAIVCLVAVTGYAYQVHSFYQPSGQLPMPLLVALGLLLLAGGALATHPERGLIALLTGSGTGSRLARRFLPVAILLPIAEGWLKLQGERAGLYSRELGVAFFAVATVVLLCAATLWNLTSLNAAEARLLQAKDAAEAANKELEAFSYSVSHDLRAPLRAIDGFGLALLEDYDAALDERGKGYLSRIRAGAQRMGLLIDDLLKLAGVTRSELRHVRVDLSALAREVIDELRVREPARQVESVVQEGLITSGDPQLLKVALVNLVGNAWKFSSRKVQARIEVGQSAVKPSTYFVKDNGAGFDMQYAHKLFGAFQRLHPMADFPGTGIGLATVQRVIHRHGGHVWAEGVLDQGTTIYFTLQRDGA